MRLQLSARLNRNLVRAAGLSLADYEVLVSLSEACEGRLRAFRLADALRWEKSRLSHHLTRMQRRGLLRREECPTDRRGAFVVLTDAGRTAIERAAPEHVEDVRRAFVDVLTPAQLDALDEISRAVLARLSDDDDSPGSEPGAGGPPATRSERR
ncbi:MAG: MarR family transcriptional regulator [Actinomycetota bacterium]|nr:MarR family transcriptional regulator [Actinomycetota bacterium]